MNQAAFLAKLAEILDVHPSVLTPNTELSTLAEYDSLAIMGVIALANETFGVTLSGSDLASVTTVRDLMNLVGVRNTEA